jgi:hypothetical protein
VGERSIVSVLDGDRPGTGVVDVLVEADVFGDDGDGALGPLPSVRRRGVVVAGAPDEDDREDREAEDPLELTAHDESLLLVRTRRYRMSGRVAPLDGAAR